MFYDCIRVFKNENEFGKSKRLLMESQNWIQKESCVKINEKKGKKEAFMISNRKLRIKHNFNLVASYDIQRDLQMQMIL